MRTSAVVSRIASLVVLLALLLLSTGVVRADAQTASTASFSGTVRGPSGPVGQVQVSLNPVGMGSWGFVLTGADGTYSFSGLAPGDYKVAFGPMQAGLLNEWWNNKPDQTTADVLHLEAGENRLGIDALLEALPSISGTVSGPGGPVSGATVTVMNGTWPVRSVLTAADGTYRVEQLQVGVPYQISFVPPSQSPLLDEWWNDKPNRASADSVTLARGEARTGIDAVLPVGASISGTVSGPSGPVAEATVTVLDGFGLVRYASTGTDGRYSVVGLVAGRYQVSFVPPSQSGLLDEWWNDKPLQASADWVTVASGEAKAGIDAVLPTGASILGTVSGPSGPVTSATVTVADGFGLVRYASTGAGGGYSVVGLPGGSYQVSFVPPSQSGLLDEWWNNKPDQASADWVTVATGEVRTGIDAVLPVGASISGIVTGRSGPVAEATVVVTDGVGFFRYANTDATGHYTAVGLEAGSYQVSFMPPSQSGLVDEWWNDKFDQASADWVTVAAGEARTGIDADLSPTGSISGRITLQGGENLRRSALIYATGGPGMNAPVAADGTYTLGGLRPSSYKVQFFAEGAEYVSEWWDNKPNMDAATVILLGPGENRTGIDAELTKGASISGAVSGPFGPVNGVEVALWSESGVRLPSAYTDSAGHFTLARLVAGRYKIQFATPWWVSNYVGEWWNDKADLASADLIVLAMDEVRTGVDATLAYTGAGITGTVTGPSGAVAGVMVSIRGVSTVDWYSATTGPDGRYVAPISNPGSYRVYFSPPYGSDLLSEWWNDKANEASADVVWASAGEIRTGIDAQLAVKASISGVVTGPSGPLAGISVSASPLAGGTYGSSTTGPDGAYTVRGLEAGSYRVSFDPPYDRSYRSEYWNDKVNYWEADAVTLAPSEARTGVDASLALLPSVSGTVTSPEGAVSGVGVRLVPIVGGIWASATTGPDGVYHAVRLSPGTYRVEFEPASGSAYLGEWWNDKATELSADPVVVGEAETVTGIDALLARGASVSGVVTTAIGLVAGVPVSVSSDDHSVYRTATTSSDGTYQVVGLPSGSYRVHFGDYSTDVAVQEWWDDKPDEASADPLVLATGEARTGIDALLVRTASISGAVTGPDGLPRDGVVQATSLDGRYSRSAYIQYPYGTYTVSGLPPGDYRVHFEPWSGSGLDDEWWNDSPSVESAEPLTLSEGEHRTGIDAVFDPAASISGTVTAPSVELANMLVYLYDASGAYRGYAYTDPEGSYRFAGLHAGSYVVEFNPDRWFGLATEWWNDKPDRATADVIVLARSEQRAGIDAVLDPLASVSGRVTAPSAPGASILVYLRNTSLTYFGSAWTAVDGTYQFTDLLPGSYIVEFNPHGWNGVLTEWWDDRPDRASADVIVLARGEQRTGIDAVLEPPNQSPRVTIDGPSVADEGTVVTFTAVASDPDGDDLTVTWDLDDDGSFEIIGTSVAVAAVEGPAELPVAIRVTDPHGVSSRATATLVVKNVAPSVVVESPTAGTVVGAGTGTVLLEAAVTDPGVEDATRCDIDWGDRTTRSVATVDGRCRDTHVYADPGRHGLTVRAVDDDSGWTEKRVTVEVAPGFVPLAPARLLETRAGVPPTVDGQASGIGLRGAGSVTELQVTGRAGVPADAIAVVLNVTVTEPEAPGYVTAYPCGTEPPNASNLNFTPGQTTPNAVIVKIGTGGRVCLYTMAPTHLLADLNGYYPAGSSFVPTTPARLLETRAGVPPTVDGQASGIGLRGAGSVTELQVTGRAGVPADAIAVVLNVTVTEPEAPGYVTAYPCGTEPPNASNLNFTPGQTTPNAVIVKIGTGGRVCLYTMAPTHLLADLNGYYPA